MLSATKATLFGAIALNSASYAFEQTEKITSYINGESTADPQELSLIDSVGTAPCVFKLGDSFYDYTPIKLAYPHPVAPYFDGHKVPHTTTPEYEFIFGWCQVIEDIDT